MTRRRPPVFAPYLGAFLSFMVGLCAVIVIGLWLCAIWADDPLSGKIGETAFVCFVVGCIFGFGRWALWLRENPDA